MGIEKLVLYVLAFGLLSFGSSIIISAVTAITRRVKLAPFTFSFFVLGALTSITEVAVGINALTLHQPEIFVGSLLGGTLAIFLVVIPLFAILTNQVHVKKHMSEKKLLLMLAIITTPAFFTLDQTVTRLEAMLLIFLYLLLFSVIRTRDGSLAKVEKAFRAETKGRRFKDNTFLRLGIGTAAIFFSSRFIVHQTLVYSEHYNVSAFWVSLVVIAIGATLPELALAVHAARQRSNDHASDAAIGNFLGSAAANVILFGAFVLISGGITINKNFTLIYLFISLAVGSFFLMAHGKVLTRREGIALLLVYFSCLGVHAVITT
jgi:cation:H+ antiporter